MLQKLFYNKKGGFDSEKRILFRKRKYIRLFERALKGVCPIRNCSYVDSDLKGLKTHIETCVQLDPADFVCFVCWYTTQNEPQMKKHIFESHNKDIADLADQEEEFTSMSGSGDDDDDDDDEDDDNQFDSEQGEQQMPTKQNKRRSSPTNDHQGTNSECVFFVSYLKE